MISESKSYIRYNCSIFTRFLLNKSKIVSIKAYTLCKNTNLCAIITLYETSENLIVISTLALKIKNKPIVIIQVSISLVDQNSI